MNSYKELRISDIDEFYSNIRFGGYQLTGSQLFIKNLFNPNTLYKHLLINWQTGVGKSVAAISIANEFIKFYQTIYSLSKVRKPVYILGFNTLDTIQADLLKYPELGYVNQQEVDNLRSYIILNEDAKYAQLSSKLHRRLTDMSYGSGYTFIGYKEFVNMLFQITEKGLFNKISLYDVFLTENENNLQQLIDNEYIIVNNELLESLKNSLIIADEIHNTYNSLYANNYGKAIQYVLDTLKEDAPRTVYMSATPFTGNASESIDLLNLLHPNLNLQRKDFFYKNSDGIFQLKPNALEKISSLTVGNVSYLLDTNIELYPQRIFIGSSISGIPYIKLNVSKESELHKNTIKQIDSNQFSSYVLYDMVFPNPDSTTVGLYSDIENTLTSASTEWKTENNIDIYTSEGSHIITGMFLHINNLQTYSSKYYNVMTDILDLIKHPKSGKIMVYHHNVHDSGVLLLQEMFKVNGIIDDISEPNNNTLCSVCGIIYDNHTDNTRSSSDNTRSSSDNTRSSSHIFKPCRFIIAHSNIHKSILRKNIIKFNDISNLYGYDYKFIIGSRIIREGLNFKAVRYQYILSLPINFSILIQVLGRVVRKNSHIDLPKEYQNVYIKIYANEIEIPRYKLKASEYLIIQEVERVFRNNAVDNFINYKKVQTSIDTLESLKFKPMNIKKPPITTRYFDAYGHNDYEISLIKQLIKIVFDSDEIKVYSYNDLWDKLQSISDVNYNLKIIDKTNFDIALLDYTNVNNEYYINMSNIDIECYARRINEKSNIDINLTKIYMSSLPAKIFSSIMEYYTEKYIDGFIELSLIELPELFHIELLRLLITSKNITKDDKLVKDLYTRFKILIIKDNKCVGYIDKISANLFDGTKWYNEPLDKYNIGNRFNENNFIIGYVSEKQQEVKFKIRQTNDSNKYSDMRLIKKGILCENNVREDILNILTELRKINNSTNNNINYVSTYDKSLKGKLSIEDICTLIKLYLLLLEENSRSISMESSFRWVYLFHDNLPNILVKI
jgi:hypothetical protein